MGMCGRPDCAGMLNLDTHILLYALNGELTPKERQALTAQPWSISAIVLWEIAKLAELGRIEVDLDGPELTRVLSRIHTWPITLDICRALRRLDFRSDPADELIAAIIVCRWSPATAGSASRARSRRRSLRSSVPTDGSDSRTGDGVRGAAGGARMARAALRRGGNVAASAKRALESCELRAVRAAGRSARGGCLARRRHALCSMG